MRREYWFIVAALVAVGATPARAQDAPAKPPVMKHAAAGRFAEFLLSPETQEFIGQFGVDKFGEPLFFVNKKN